MQIAKSRLCRTSKRIIFLPVALLAAGAIAHAAPGENGNGKTMSAKRTQIVQFWTQDRRDAATPRDLRIDPRGLGYLRRADGSLQPYGHQVAAQAQAGQAPRAKPPSGKGPTEFADMDPASGSVIGSSYTFSAIVTDPDGLRSVSFVIQYPNGNTQSFSPSQDGSTWSLTISGFTNGNWNWWIVAKDGASRGGNTTTSDPVNFFVDTGGEPPPPPPPPPPGGTVTNSEWLNGGDVQTATGRIYFQMPDKRNRRRWSGYVCSGTAVVDGTAARSVILTAAHCVYDDANKAFARNVLFIPDQAGTTGSGTDTNCGNDPFGCWIPSFGVVDSDWTTRTFPNNIPWDYAYYVVSDTGAHSGNGGGPSIALDGTVATLPIQFSAPSLDTYTHALGYSYSDDPNFMYCAENMGTEGSDNWWLASCELSGGSSGGPWVQPMCPDLDQEICSSLPDGSGPLISVNSWGYTTSAGMAGPKFYLTSAECLFNLATGTPFNSVPGGDGDEGVSGC